MNAPTAQAHRTGWILLLDRLLDITVGIALIGELLVVIGNVLGRTFIDAPLLWSDEVATLALSTIAFIGGAVAYRRDAHISVRTIVNMLPEKTQAVVLAGADWVVLGLGLLSFFYSIGLVEARWEELTPILEMRGAWFAVPLSVGMVMLAVYALVRLYEQPRGAVLAAFVAVLVLAAPFVLFGFLADAPMANGSAISIALLLVLVTVLLGLPVGFALMLGTILYLHIGTFVPLIAVPQNMVDGVGRFVLLALPFFIFAGFIMEGGGISRRLVELIAALVGRLRGGLMQVMVVSMYIVSGISGSKAADVAAVGLVMRDMLDEEGYDRAEAAAVLAASAAMGECIPPSLAMLVLGSVTSLSIGALFAAGLIPAAVIALCLMALIYFRAAKFNTRQHGSRNWPLIRRLALRAIIPFSMPALLFGGIFSGFATPTEISAFAVAYGLAIAALLYREVNLRQFGRMIAEASTVSAMVLFTLAAAQTFSWVLSAAQLPHSLAALVATWHDNATLFMLASITAVVILGSLLEGLPALLILAPLLLPLAPDLGIDPLHYGIVLLVAMGIGAFLPPLGVGFYIACAVTRAPVDRASAFMIPYVLILLIGLLLVTFVPWFTLLVPGLLGFAS
ncbi:TRAP transporter large permease subunit [Ancylobacter sp. MQZ15Z-1]|uniref:TRAP transporter large permease subunit n=1 Tax=Ancylobacter mangrovi TaxID=2972472 RepID=A0A9X2PEK2_9HYPH|nr:TRAP transporter large permease subunit [Ancylobacter mangrovi]MCS0497276.1 TRAP transporter large permease subunit [Ancylobacter mangrovi]